MNKRLCGAVVVVALSLLAGVVSAGKVLYDDFSSGVLDPVKWAETTASGFPDTHAIVEDAYVAAQATANGHDVSLEMTKALTDETVEYDLFYVSGSGDHRHEVVFDASGLGWGERSFIGFWGGPGEVGSQTGRYHVTHDFDSLAREVTATVKRPDGTVWTKTIDLSRAAIPYRFFLMETTGDNGVMRFEVDNVLIATLESSPLEERVADLEERVAGLEAQVDELDGRVTGLESGLGLLTEQVNLLVGYLTSIPFRFREYMVCGYMEGNALESHAGLGLTCRIEGEECGCVVSSPLSLFAPPMPFSPLFELFPGREQ